MEGAASRGHAIIYSASAKKEESRRDAYLRSIDFLPHDAVAEEPTTWSSMPPSLVPRMMRK